MNIIASTTPSSVTRVSLIPTSAMSSNVPTVDTATENKTISADRHERAAQRTVRKASAAPSTIVRPMLASESSARLDLSPAGSIASGGESILETTGAAVPGGSSRRAASAESCTAREARSSCLR